ncbi:MAG: S8 family serine peptidase [Cytophagales bacterium]|nr:S8 family serine peptidase [Cytophagales bacterium]
MKKLAIFNMAYVRAILISFSILFTLVVFGQTQTQRQQIRAASNTSVLEQMAVHFDSIYTIQKAEAEQWAIDSGYTIRGNLPDGGSFEIIKITNGAPIYNITNNLNAAKTVSTNKVWTGGGAGLDLDGTQIYIGQWDGGHPNDNNPELSGNIIHKDCSICTYSTHATHVAGTMIAKGVDTTAKGMASESSLFNYQWNNDISEMATEASYGLLLSNHSYGTGCGWVPNFCSFYCCEWWWLGDVSVNYIEDYKFGFYSDLAKSWDTIANNAPYYLIVKAAGNDRFQGPAALIDTFDCWNNDTTITINSIKGKDCSTNGGYDCIPERGTAKNILTVGAIDDIPSGYTDTSDIVMSSFSGWGPTDDGRIKPDIVANGVNLYSCITDSSYGSKSGTSMSSPNVTGSLALLQQHYSNTYAGLFMHSSTLKALVIHTTDEAGTANGPDYKHGWGLMNTNNAANLINQDSINCFNNIQELVLNNGDTFLFDFDYNGTSPFIKATIVWNDPAGIPVTSGNPPDLLDPPDLMLINDLDLRIIRQSDGQVFFPWTLNPLNPTNPADTTQDNFRDNVEQVFFSTLTAGTYTVRVTHKGTLQGGNSQAFSLIISGASFDLSQIKLKISSTDVICNGDSNGTATVIACGGTPPYTYLWSDGQTNAFATGLAPGSYTVTITDSFGLIANKTVTINESPALSVSLSAKDISCTGYNDGIATAIPVGGSPGYFYLWSSGENTSSIVNKQNGIYYVTVTDANGCTVTESTTINEPPPLTLSITKTDVSCYGGSTGTATASASGGTPPYWYIWKSFLWSQSSNAYIYGSFTATGLYPATFTVEVWDTNNCYITDSVTITVPPLLSASTTTTNNSCSDSSNGTATIIATGGTPPYSYLWITFPVQSTATATALAAGTYTYFVEDTNGCFTSGNVTITDDSLLSVSIITSDQVCNKPIADGSASAVVTGGLPPYTYLWDDPDNQTSETATGLEAGIYNATVTDANGCIIIGSGTVNSTPPVYDFVNPVIDTIVYWQFGSFKVLGEVIIDSGGVLHMGWSKFEFSYDVINEAGFDYDRARIVIKPGGKLISNYDTLTGCGGGPWDGIENWGDKTKPQNNADQGVLVMNNTTIINAQRGIFCGRRSLINVKLTPHSGGIVKATNSAFINNYLAVKMRSYPDFNSISYFKNCNFEYNSSTPFEYIFGQKMEFINLFDHHGLKILGCHFINTTPGDFAIQDRGWGIKSTDASYIVDELCINQQQFPCPAFQPTIFENLYYGIEATATNSLNSVSITKSKFLNNTRGILLRGVDFAVITENEFDLAPFIDDPGSYSYGFYLENCTGYLAEGNIIYSTSTTGVFGSYIENSGNDANELYRNQYYDLLIASSIAGNNLGTEIRCNSYINIVGVDILAIGSLALDQGFCSPVGDLDEDKTPAGNQFSYTTSEGEISAYLVPSINYNHHSNGNVYHTTPLNYSTPYINPVPCPGSQFIPDVSCPSNLPPDCDIACQQALIFKYKNKADILKDHFDGGDKANLLVQINKVPPLSPNQLKNMLLSTSPYLTDEVLIAAIDRIPPLPPNILRDILIANSPLTDKVLNALQNRAQPLPPAAMANINAVQTGISAREELVREVKYFINRRELSVHAKIRYYLHSDTIPGAMDSVIAILEQEEALKDQEEVIELPPVERHQPRRKLADAHLKRGNYINAQQMVDTLNQVPEFENFGRLKQIMIDIELSNETYFEIKDDTIKEAKVRYVATDSAKYGYIHARAMLDRVFNERIPEKFIQFWLNNNNARLANDNTEDIIAENIKYKDDSKITIYPNPAGKSFKVTLKLDNTSNNAHFHLYDILGNKVLNYRINNLHGTINFNTNNIPNGLYFYTIIVNNNTIARDKLIIHK